MARRLPGRYEFVTGIRSRLTLTCCSNLHTERHQAFEYLQHSLDRSRIKRVSAWSILHQCRRQCLRGMALVLRRARCLYRIRHCKWRWFLLRTPCWNGRTKASHCGPFSSLLHQKCRSTIGGCSHRYQGHLRHQGLENLER